MYSSIFTKVIFFIVFLKCVVKYKASLLKQKKRQKNVGSYFIIIDVDFLNPEEIVFKNWISDLSDA